MIKNPPVNTEDAGDKGLIPGWGKKSPGGGNGNPLQHFYLENPMDRGAWQAAVHGVAKSWTQLSTKTHEVLRGIWSTKTRASSTSGLQQPSVDSLTTYKSEKQKEN